MNGPKGGCYGRTERSQREDRSSANDKPRLQPAGAVRDDRRVRCGRLCALRPVIKQRLAAISPLSYSWTRKVHPDSSSGSSGDDPASCLYGLWSRGPFSPPPRISYGATRLPRWPHHPIRAERKYRPGLPRYIPQGTTIYHGVSVAERDNAGLRGRTAAKSEKIFARSLRLGIGVANGADCFVRVHGGSPSEACVLCSARNANWKSSYGAVCCSCLIRRFIIVFS